MGLARHPIPRKSLLSSGKLLAHDELPGGFNMRAIVLNGFGGLESLVIKELPDPKPKAGQVLIAVKAFGVNHAETHMRKGEWAEAATVSGIECVGVVRACPGGEFAPGTKVVAF